MNGTRCLVKASSASILWLKCNISMASHSLSKSKYTSFCQCAKQLWLNAYHPDLATVDEMTQARFEAGTEVGILAKGFLGPYEEATVRTADGRLDYAAMLNRTQALIKAGAENIAEAAFSWEGNYCAVDILHRTADGYAIYEVKSSTASVDDEGSPAELEPYVQDIAYQRYVLTQCGIRVSGTFLMRLNKDYVRGKELDIQQLFCVTDMRQLVEEHLPLVTANIAEAKRTLAKDQEPDILLGRHCKNPYECAFMDYCMRNVPQPSVFDLYRIRFASAAENYYQGIDTFAKTRNIKLTDIQQMQVECTLNGKDRVDKAAVRDFLSTLHYPLYFLDFETQQMVVPEYEGSRPYQQIPFQYSLHYIEHEGGELKHKEFLGISGKDPRRALAEQLVKDIPIGACTTAYNKAFECTRLKELAADFPDLADHLLDIKERIIDFLVPFQKGFYYRPAMGGSFSIKSVLPALFPDDPSLDYHNLEGDVHNGSEAMNIYPKIQYMTPVDQARTRKALLEYCKLDTYAMVKVFWKLLEVSE